MASRSALRTRNSIAAARDDQRSGTSSDTVSAACGVPPDEEDDPALWDETSLSAEAA
jgi:hypothetical protein